VRGIRERNRMPRPKMSSQAGISCEPRRKKKAEGMMKKTVYLIVILIAVLGLRSACPAQERTYRIEVLQITDFIAFQQAYDGFIRELARSGLVQGKNLTVKRTIIDYDVVNPTIWKKAKAL